MSLAALYVDLWRTAQETGADARRDLHGGARLAVRVSDGVTTLTIARKLKRVGDTELKTFVRDCGVPSDAARYPAGAEQATRTDADGARWYTVTYRWQEEQRY
jgi:hypothetical protein